jgi:hypothetical protein
VSSLLFAFSPNGAQAAGKCPTSPKLKSISTYTLSASYAAGGRMGYYSLPVRAAGSQYPTRISVFEGNISHYAMFAPTAKFGTSQSQKSLANSVSNFQTYINSDYFDFGTSMPDSAIVNKGELIYSPPPGLRRVSQNGGSQVLSYVDQTYNEATGYSYSAPLTSGSKKVTVAGVNLKSLPANSIVAYTSQYSAATIPRGSYGIFVKDGLVTRPFVKGTSVRPITGIVFQATGGAISYLKKFSVGNRAAFSFKSGTIKKLETDVITPSGYVEFGSDRIYVNAVNYIGGHSSGATLFDRNFGPISGQTTGSATFALDSSGVVRKISKNSGVQVSVNSSNRARVFQVFGSQAKLVSKLTVGQKVTFVNTYTSAKDRLITSASGRGPRLLLHGTNLSTCAGSSMTHRPRTAIGWNSSGRFWVVTATMGKDNNDGGFRVGGCTLRQMGDWLHQLGATEAVRFDGGGSVTQYMSVNGVAKRIDIPADPKDGHAAWVRDIPVGIAFAPG